MGSRNRTLTVKVPRTKLIEALGKAANDRRQSIAEHDKAVEKWKSDTAKAEKDFLARFKSGRVKANNVSINLKDAWQPYDPTGRQEKEIDVNICFKVPATAAKLPEKPNEKYKSHNRYGYSIKEDIEEIENAIRILNLSTDEFVPTSTYKSVAQFL